MFLGSRVDDALTLYYRHLLERHERAHARPAPRRLPRPLVRAARTEEQAARHPLGARPRRAGRLPDRPRRARAHLRRADPQARPARRRPAPARVHARARPGVDGAMPPRPRDAARGRRAARPDGRRLQGQEHTAAPLAKADHDPQAGLYLAGRWLDGDPAREFCFAQIAKPGPRRKTDQRLTRHHQAHHRAAARHARPHRPGRQPDLRAPRPLRPRAPVGLRRPQRLEMLAALLLTPRPLPRRRGL